MNSSSSYICDYVTVFFEDGVTGNLGEWSVPTSAYYYQTRGPLGLVSIADATFDAEGTEQFLIGFENGFNGSIAQVDAPNTLMPNNISIMGSMVQSSNLRNASVAPTYVYSRTEPIKILTPARPNKIRLSFWREDKQPRNVIRGSVTLKFEYLSPEAQKQVNDAVSYVPAFPEPHPF